jgi:hypothetical protein
MAARKNAVAYMVGFLIVILGQSYVALAFAATVVESARSIVEHTTGIGKWVFWISAFAVACAPTAMAAKSAASWLNEPSERSPASMISVRAMAVTSWIDLIGCVVFVFFPSAISWGWGWVPHF